MYDKYKCLQMFADGDGGGEGAVAAPDGGGSGAPETGVADQKRTFEQILEDPDYRAAYDAGVGRAVQNRLKSAKAREKQLAPMLELLAGKYGVQAGETGEFDIAALTRAVQDDDAYYEDEAIQRGMTVAELKRTKRLEREHQEMQAEIQRRQAEDERKAFFQNLQRQEAEVQAKFPGFSIEQVKDNDNFWRMMQAGVPMEAAVVALNHEKILGGAMQYAAGRAAQSVANSVQAGARRPRENGATATPAAAAVLPMTRERMEEIKQRLNRGERVVL